MEVIEQEPIQEPAHTSNGMIWKILTGVFALTAIIAIIVAIATGGSKQCTDNGSTNNSSNPSNSQSKQSSNNTPSNNTTDELALKNFDVSIGGLVNAAGFNSGSILTLKTNADGTYMLGEVKANGVFGYAYRELPNGSWKKTALMPTEETAVCEETDKQELYAFKGIIFSGAGNVELKCKHQISTGSTTLVTITEALDKDYYKSSNQFH